MTIIIENFTEKIGRAVKYKRQTHRDQAEDKLINASRNMRPARAGMR